MSSEWGRGRGQGPTEPPWLDGLRQPACGAEMASKLPPPPLCPPLPHSGDLPLRPFCFAGNNYFASNVCS